MQQHDGKALLLAGDPIALADVESVMQVEGWDVTSRLVVANEHEGLTMNRLSQPLPDIVAQCLGDVNLVVITAHFGDMSRHEGGEWLGLTLAAAIRYHKPLVPVVLLTPGRIIPELEDALSDNGVTVVPMAHFFYAKIKPKAGKRMVRDTHWHNPIYKESGSGELDYVPVQRPIALIPEDDPVWERPDWGHYYISAADPRLDLPAPPLWSDRRVVVNGDLRFADRQMAIPVPDHTTKAGLQEWIRVWNRCQLQVAERLAVTGQQRTLTGFRGLSVMGLSSDFFHGLAHAISDGRLPREEVEQFLPHVRALVEARVAQGTDLAKDECQIWKPVCEGSWDIPAFLANYQNSHHLTHCPFEWI